MPRYHFNVYDGVSTPDDEGTDLPDEDDARREAIRLAGRLLDEEASRLALGELWHMDVMGEDGLVLFRLDFQVTLPPRTRARASSIEKT